MIYKPRTLSTGVSTLTGYTITRPATGRRIVNTIRVLNVSGLAGEVRIESKLPDGSIVTLYIANVAIGETFQLENLNFVINNATDAAVNDGELVIKCNVANGTTWTTTDID